MDQVAQACGNCGRAHPPRVCPAYKDACKFCGKIGHWKKFCRKHKGTNRLKDVQQRGDTKPDGKQHRDAGKGSRRRDRRFHDLEPAASYTSEEDSTEPYDCICISSVRNEVFTTLDVICPWKKGIRKIKLKVDTGAAGNTLPLRTYKQMYKTLPPKDVLEPTRNVKLVAYNGQEIPCLGSINLQLRFGEKKLHKGQVLCRWCSISTYCWSANMWENWTSHYSLWWPQTHTRCHNRGRIEASVSRPIRHAGGLQRGVQAPPEARLWTIHRPPT